MKLIRLTSESGTQILIPIDKIEIMAELERHHTVVAQLTISLTSGAKVKVMEDLSAIFKQLETMGIY